jgi:hypothetical protein
MILNLEFAIVPFLQHLCGFEHIEFVNRTSFFAGTYFEDLWTDCMHMAIKQLKSMDVVPYQFSDNPTMLYTYLRGSPSIAKLVNFIVLPIVCAVVPQILNSESSIMLFPDGGDSDNYKEKCANYVSSDFDGLSEDEKSRLIFQKSPINLYNSLDGLSILSCCKSDTSVDFYFHDSRCGTNSYEIRPDNTLPDTCGSDDSQLESSSKVREVNDANEYDYLDFFDDLDYVA